MNYEIGRLNIHIKIIIVLFARYTVDIRNIIVHILLALAIYVNPNVLVIYLILFGLKFLMEKDVKTDSEKISILLYILSFEVLMRSLNLFYIPYEFGKYLFFIFLMLQLFGQNVFRNGYYLLLLLPGIIYGILSYNVSYKYIVFDGLGPLNMTLAIIYFRSKFYARSEYFSIFYKSIFAVLTTAITLILLSPSYNDYEFSLSAMNGLSGGFGSNQVSTLMGVGLLMIYFCHILEPSWYRLAIVPPILYQGIITFSRGGMLTMILGVLSLILISRKFPKGIVVLSLLVVFVFSFVNQISDNKLFLRYLGETEGTSQGYRTKDLNVITSGRFSLIQEELKSFGDNFFTGLGVTGSRWNRTGHVGGTNTHTEWTRLLSEHGFLGLLILVLLLQHGYSLLMRRRITFLFFVIGILTGLHSATRLFVVPFFIGLSFARRKAD